MIQTYLIADSGGTQTDWCFIDQEKQEHYFTTSSFHPVEWTEEFIEAFHAFWKNREHMKSAHVHFYGAGCSNPSNQIKIKEIFNLWGFNKVQVYSDLLGACHATLNEQNGFVGILGTGSVVCEYIDEEITRQIGGLGYILGDEGSGYYFGKMVLSTLLNGGFSDELMQKIITVLGDRSLIMRNVYDYSTSKQFIGSIASKLSFYNNDVELVKLHRQNIELFVNQLPDSCSEIALIGRYAFFNQSIIEEVLSAKNIKLLTVLEEPIKNIVSNRYNN